MTTGRNELCPCGSGKKYKRCHDGAELERQLVGTVAPPEPPKKKRAPPTCSDCGREGHRAHSKKPRCPRPRKHGFAPCPACDGEMEAMRDEIEDAPNPDWPYDEYWFCRHCGREWDLEDEKEEPRRTLEGRCGLHPWPRPDRVSPA